jgi:hypothetical protein
MHDERTPDSTDYTPGEHGLEGGHMWAERSAGTAADLDIIAAGVIPADGREAVEPGVLAGWRTRLPRRAWGTRTG